MCKILFIVEGVSDKSFYRPIFQRILKPTVKFEITDGDLTSRFDNSEDAKEIITNFLKDKYYRKPFKYDKIIMLTDIDGCFIGDRQIKKDLALNKKYYDENYMYVYDKNKQKLTNKKKSINLECLYKTNKLFNTDFEIYYNCINLEHVYHNDPNMNSNLKVRKSEESTKIYSENLNLYIQFLHNKDILLSEDYISSWKLLGINNNSLKRLTNLWVFFKRHPEFIKEDTICEDYRKNEVSKMNLV